MGMISLSLIFQSLIADAFYLCGRQSIRADPI
jgi:hypothetical protein